MSANVSVYHTEQIAKQGRSDKILSDGRKIGEQKKEKGPIACFFRKWAMIVFLKFFVSEGMMDSSYTTLYTKDIFGD